LLSFLKRSPAAGGVVCLGIHSDGVALTHLVRNGLETPRLAVCEYRPLEGHSDLSRTVAGAVREHALAGAACVGVLPPDQYSLRLVDAPDVELEELGDAARWLVNDLVDFDVDEAAVDFFEIPQQQARGRPSRIYVVAAEASVVQRVVDVANGSGLKLAAIDITELALRNLTALLPEDAQGLALMHLGRRGGLITMTQEGHLYLARQLEADLDQLVAPPPQALEADSDLGHAPDTQMLDVLLLEVQRSLDYYESQLGQSPPANLVIAPLEREIPELLPFLQDNLALNVRTLDLNDLITCSRPLPDEVQARCLSLVGAALRTEPTAP